MITTSIIKNKKNKKKINPLNKLNDFCEIFFTLRPQLCKYLFTTNFLKACSEVTYTNYGYS